jgi:hypothetical protein
MDKKIVIETIIEYVKVVLDLILNDEVDTIEYVKRAKQAMETIDFLNSNDLQDEIYKTYYIIYTHMLEDEYASKKTR